MSSLTEHHAYMRYLASLPREAKCACGYAPIGKCHRCSDRPLPRKEIPPHDSAQLSLFPHTSQISHERG